MNFSSGASKHSRKDTVSIHDSLNEVITTVSNSAKKAQIISINASILANGNRDQSTLAGFEVVAEEIRTLSTSSLENISSLENLLEQLRSVSSTINKAGRQRMLAQKALKLHLAVLHANGSETDYKEQYRATTELFENSLRELMALSMNSMEIQNQLSKAGQTWGEFTQSLRSSELEEWTRLNDLVVFEMNHAVELYEKLVG